MTEFKERLDLVSEVAVLGGSGLVGSRFIELTKPQFSPTSSEVDITSREEIRRWVEGFKGDVIINFAAYTNVDGAEEEWGDLSGQVWKINVESARNLAIATRETGKFLIHISTDFVFPGTESYPGPYPENSPPPGNAGKLSWYGYTKLKGEEAVRERATEYAIARISYPYRAQYDRKTDFARNIISLYDQVRLYPMFSDQQMTPTFIDEGVFALQKIVKLKKPGVYHIASSSLTSPFEFASYLLERARGVRNIAQAGSMEQFLKTPGRTPRPRIGGLKTQETQKRLSMSFMGWQEAVDEFVRQLLGK